MKKTNVCPKCGGTDIVKVPGTASGSGRYCYNEVPLGLFMVAAPVDRFVCCTCGYSEEWLRESDLKKVKKYWAETAQ